MDYQSFVNGEKTLLIAPAGYGKTHTIVECLKYLSQRQLILTHTHAGVSSIKDKIKKAEIHPKSYHVETISSFSQKYVHSFYIENDLLPQDHKDYHSQIVQKAIDIFESPLVKSIIKKSYSGLFVDEYQDCTKQQHKMLMVLSDILPTHLLGDPLQAIFDFQEEIVDFEADLTEFERFPDLAIPFRWYQDGNNSILGDKVKKIRECLLNEDSIDVIADNDNGFHVIKTSGSDLRDPQSVYRKTLDKLIKNPDQKKEFESLLIIVPSFEEVKDGFKIPRGGISDREKIRSQIDYSKSKLKLLEAIDDKSFYSIAKDADKLISSLLNRRARKPIKSLLKVLGQMFNKSDLNEWFNDKGIKTKRKADESLKAETISIVLERFLEKPSAKNLHIFISDFKKLMGLRFKREEIAFSFLHCLKQAQAEKISLYDGMKKNRNVIRRSGRKVYGKCIGTTLLTKGLEFDTVAILDAHKFNCPKNFYVSISRCCKRLIIYTEQKSLRPYKI